MSRTEIASSRLLISKLERRLALQWSSVVAIDAKIDPELSQLGWAMFFMMEERLLRLHTPIIVCLSDGFLSCLGKGLL